MRFLGPSCAFVGFEPIVVGISALLLRSSELFFRSGNKSGPNVGTHASNIPPVISPKTKMELSMAQYEKSASGEHLKFCTSRPRLMAAVL
jgi:hypothetical protein